MFMFMFNFPRNDITELSQSDGRFHFACIDVLYMYYDHLLAINCMIFIVVFR